MFKQHSNGLCRLCHRILLPLSSISEVTLSPPTPFPCFIILRESLNSSYCSGSSNNPKFLPPFSSKLLLATVTFPLQFANGPVLYPQSALCYFHYFSSFIQNVILVLHTSRDLVAFSLPSARRERCCTGIPQPFVRTSSNVAILFSILFLLTRSIAILLILLDVPPTFLSPSPP